MDDLIEIFHLYDVHDSPAAVLISPVGTIASVPVVARRGIEALIRQVLAENAPVAVPSVSPAAAPAA
jgi:hypothetical protein